MINLEAYESSESDGVVSAVESEHGVTMPQISSRVADDLDLEISAPIIVQRQIGRGRFNDPRKPNGDDAVVHGWVTIPFEAYTYLAEKREELKERMPDVLSRQLAQEILDDPDYLQELTAIMDEHGTRMQ